MFSKASKSAKKAETGNGAAAPAAKPKPSGVPSIISADLSIVGDLTSHGDLQVDGVVDGDITSRTLTIGENAKVNGSISADRMRICGTVTGQLRAESVVLAKTAKVQGDVIHETLEIEAGAFIEGSIRRSGTERPDFGTGLAKSEVVAETPPANGSGGNGSQSGETESIAS